MKLRKAKLGDVETIINLINTYADQGLMLPRSRSMLYEGIREFLVAEEDGDDKGLIGAGALHILWDDLAEIRSLAVAPGYTGKSIGTTIVKALIEEAYELGCQNVFALTYQPEFFLTCGFRIVNKEDMPHKVWKECINCVKFPNCDEIAVMLP